MSDKNKVQDMKQGWIPWVNSDSTEGRGYQYPLAICDLKATAERIGKKADVMGSDATVLQCTLYKIDGLWYGPVRVDGGTPEDVSRQKVLTAKDAARKRAKELGLSDDEISIIATY